MIITQIIKSSIFAEMLAECDMTAGNVIAPKPHPQNYHNDVFEKKVPDEDNVVILRYYDHDDLVKPRVHKAKNIPMLKRVGLIFLLSSFLQLVFNPIWIPSHGQHCNDYAYFIKNMVVNCIREPFRWHAIKTEYFTVHSGIDKKRFDISDYTILEIGADPYFTFIVK